ncbi:hypothetical protein BIW11_14098 [Tropilaelaps mercedesae]|uniref:LIM zinc-binding domain-containing protein n=1 Tax=Tropilaelaps mercedesae TaxID=418985 RepID=A0A1V9WZ18_9ACAR|nr:hypothetical protein BIW11_14098 [Tropilaelaps mercedesae]
MARHSRSSSAVLMSRPLRWRTFHERRVHLLSQSSIQETTHWFGGAEDTCDSWMFSSFNNESKTQTSLHYGQKGRHKQRAKSSTGEIKGFPPCPYCSREVLEAQESTVITIFGLKWHNSCFRCDRCSRQLQALGGFICLLNSPICMECYLAIHPKDQGRKSLLDVDKASRYSRSGNLLVPDETYGSARSASLASDLFGIVYFNESDNNLFFEDSFVTVEQFDTSQDLVRRNSTPLFVYSKIQPSSDYGFASFSGIFASDDDGLANQSQDSQSQDSTLGKFHSALTGCEADAATFSRLHQCQLARKPCWTDESNHSGSYLSNVSFCTPISCTDDEIICSLRDETALVRRDDTPAPLRSIFDKWKDLTMFPNDMTFIIVPDTFRQRSLLTSLRALKNITSYVGTHEAPETVVEISVKTRNTLVDDWALPDFAVSCQRGKCRPHCRQDGERVVPASTPRRRCVVVKICFTVAILFMAAVFLYDVLCSGSQGSTTGRVCT